MNRQYTKEEYEKLRAEIIESMKKDGTYGKFFPYNMAYGGYNLSTANTYFPESKENIIRLGGYWEERNESRADGMATTELPDDIADVGDSITSQPLVCPETGSRFNIAPQELTLLRQFVVPLPRLHPDARTLGRFRQISVITPSSCSCFFCQKDIQAYYPLEWGYKKVACEDCYQQQIV